MGYTHYWKQERPFTDEEWGRMIEHVKAVYKNLPKHSVSSRAPYPEVPLIIRGSDGTGEPDFGYGVITFNGDAETVGDYGYTPFTGTEDMSHDTFFLESDVVTDFEFCKTARKPYDLFVQAVLILASHHNDGFTFKSDGFIDEWDAAVKLVNDTVDLFAAEELVQHLEKRSA